MRGGAGDFVAALGLMLLFEGIVYALAPGFMKDLLARAHEMPDAVMRWGGLAAAILGVVLVWTVRH